MRNPNVSNWLGGIAVGALAMYLADPQQGKRRRMLLQEKTRHASERTGSALSSVLHQTGNRISSPEARAKHLAERSDFSDESIRLRARKIVDKLVSVPNDIRISAEQGVVTLSGLVALKEKDRLMQKLRGMPGIQELRDRMEAKPAGRKQWFRKEGRQSAQATPNHGAALGAAGLAAVARRLPIGPFLAVAGLGYAIQRLGRRSSPSAELRSNALRERPRTDEIHLQKSIEIQASPETVFNIWSKYDNFPQFMSYLIDVHSVGTDRAHWIVQGPAGVNLEWDTVLTKYMEPTMLAWNTEAGAPIEHHGSVRFESSSNGGTRATVRMFYGPAAGSAGNSIAMLLGPDPEQELEADLERMKAFIEGKNFARDIPQFKPSPGQVLH